MNATVTDARLLQGVRAAVSALASRCDGAETQQILSSANALLDELTLRTDREFYSQYLGRGEALLALLPEEMLHRISGADRRRFADLASKPVRTDFNAVTGQIEALRKCFADVSGQLAAEDPRRHASVLEKLLTWEAEIYMRSAQFKAPAVAAPVEPVTREKLQEYLTRKFPDRPDLRIVEYRPLVGGLQKLTILFDVEDRAEGRQSLVLRGEQPDRFMLFDLGLIADEYQIVKVAFEAGLPVAEPLWLEADPGVLGRRFMVSRKVPGINYGHATGVHEIPQSVGKAFVVALAKLHAVPAARYADIVGRTPLARWLRFDSLPANTAGNMEYWRTLPREREYGSSPALAALFAWLVKNVPGESGTACFVHCDYGPHNVLIDDQKVSGILDWESTRIGDPAEDLSYFLQCTAAHLAREDVLRWYEEAGGARISEQRLRYFDVFNVLKVLMACLAARAIYGNDVTARNEWTPLAFQYMHFPLSLVQQRLAAAESLRDVD